MMDNECTMSGYNQHLYFEVPKHTVLKGFLFQFLCFYSLLSSFLKVYALLSIKRRHQLEVVSRSHTLLQLSHSLLPVLCKYCFFDILALYTPIIVVYIHGEVTPL